MTQYEIPFDRWTKTNYLTLFLRPNINSGSTSSTPTRYPTTATAQPSNLVHDLGAAISALFGAFPWTTVTLISDISSNSPSSERARGGALYVQWSLQKHSAYVDLLIITIDSDKQVSPFKNALVRAGDHSRSEFIPIIVHNWILYTSWNLCQKLI